MESSKKLSYELFKKKIEDLEIIFGRKLQLLQAQFYWNYISQLCPTEKEFLKSVEIIIKNADRFPPISYFNKYSPWRDLVARTNSGNPDEQTDFVEELRHLGLNVIRTEESNNDG